MLEGVPCRSSALALGPCHPVPGTHRIDVPSEPDECHISVPIGGCLTKFFWRTLLLVLAVALHGMVHADTITADALVHSSWSMSQGAPADIWCIAQSPDGFLWLGTGSGLYRFDGVQFETPRLANGQAFPSGNMTALLLARNGAIWVGYFTGGVARLKDGKLTSYPLPGVNPSGWVSSLAETPDGSVWAATAGGLFRFEHGAWQLVDERMGVNAGPVSSLLVDPDGTLWATGVHHLLFLRAGERHFRPTNIPVNIFTTIGRSPDGTLWLSDQWSGVRALPGVTVDHPLGDPTIPPPTRKWLSADRLVFDRHGRMWGTDIVHKFLFIIDHPAAYESGRPLRVSDASRRFGSGDDLTSDRMTPLFEDAEGTVWAGSNLGLDSFREATVAPVAGVSRDEAPDALLAAAPDGSLWTATSSSLMRVIDGVAHPVAPSPKYLVRLAPASNNEVWILTPRAVIHYVRGHSTRLDLPRQMPGYQGVLAVDRRQGLWVAVRGVGLMHLAKDRFDPPVRTEPWATAITALEVSSKNLLWVVSMSGRITELSIQEKDIAHFNAHGLGKIWSLDTEAPYPVVGGDRGVGILDGGHVVPVTSLGDLTLSGVTGIANRNGVMWLNTIRGIVRIGWKELVHAAFDPSYRPAYRLFDSHDGLRGVALQSASKTLGFDDSGRIWARTNQEPLIIDPEHIVKNTGKPKVFVSSVVTDEKTYMPVGDVELPAGTSRVQLKFTSTSLAVPSHVHFRYRLSNVDRDWRDSGALREAFYTNLSPGHYVFSVFAENEDGVCSAQPASVDFYIPPTFMQSSWTRASMMLGVLAVVFFLIRRKIVGYRKGIELQIRAQIMERERIARDLHDTLMQAVQALMLRFSIVLDGLTKSDPARRPLEESLDVARRVVDEGRDRLVSLRSYGSESASLVGSINRIAGDLTDLYGTPVVFQVEGRPQVLLDTVVDDISAVVREAATNALKHAMANNVKITLCFDVKGAHIVVCDDGCGFSREGPAITMPGHYGIVGMHERVRQFGGKLDIKHGHGDGTLVLITLPHRLFLLSRSNSTRSVHLV